MPTIELKEKTFFLGIKCAHTNIILENHNGTMYYNPEGHVNRKATLSDQYIYNKYNDALERAKGIHQLEDGRTIEPNSRSNSTIIAAPKVNGCSVVLIKNGIDFFLLHHTPQNLEKNEVYDPLFSSLNQEDSIDILLVAGHLEEENFLAGCRSKNIKINSSRIIPSKEFFNLETFVMEGEPKSLHITYDPKDDRLMIFGDESYLDNKPSGYSAEGIFSNPEAQIVMRRIKEIINYPNNLGSKGGWDHFASHLPLTDKSFIKRASEGTYDSLIVYLDKNIGVTQLIGLLKPEDQEQAQKFSKNEVRASFVINSFLELLEEEKFKVQEREIRKIEAQERGDNVPENEEPEYKYLHLYDQLKIFKSIKSFKFELKEITFCKSVNQQEMAHLDNQNQETIDYGNSTGEKLGNICSIEEVKETPKETANNNLSQIPPEGTHTTSEQTSNLKNSSLSECIIS